MKYHVAFDVRTTIERYVEATDEEDAIDKGAMATDTPEDFIDADWQTQFIHPVTPECSIPGRICWERTT